MSEKLGIVRRPGFDEQIIHGLECVRFSAYHECERIDRVLQGHKVEIAGDADDFVAPYPVSDGYAVAQLSRSVENQTRVLFLFVVRRKIAPFDYIDSHEFRKIRGDRIAVE